MELGYALSSEEHQPLDLIRYAQRAEAAGFTFALISDHFHPWIDRQGQSPFVWTVIGGIAHATKNLRLGTGVTCPLIRTHPAIIAQAAATAAACMPGRFFLGLGTGENLNEHILGEQWPPLDVRQEMLAEAIEVIRLLWEGGSQSYYGTFYTLENARLYTLPDELPPILVAASGEESAELAGELGDGLISTQPKAELVEAFGSNGHKKNRPCIGQVAVCWAKDEAQARATALEWWPTSAMAAPLKSELPLPAHFEAAAEGVTEDAVAEKILCVPDPEQHAARIQEYVDAGFDQVYVHQIGPDQEGFFKFYEDNVLPLLKE